MQEISLAGAPTAPKALAFVDMSILDVTRSAILPRLTEKNLRLILRELAADAGPDSLESVGRGELESRIVEALRANDTGAPASAKLPTSPVDSLNHIRSAANQLADDYARARAELITDRARLIEELAKQRLEAGTQVAQKVQEVHDNAESQLNDLGEKARKRLQEIESDRKEIAGAQRWTIGVCLTAIALAQAVTSIRGYSAESSLRESARDFAIASAETKENAKQIQLLQDRVGLFPIDPFLAFAINLENDIASVTSSLAGPNVDSLQATLDSVRANAKKWPDGAPERIPLDAMERVVSTWLVTAKDLHAINIPISSDDLKKLWDIWEPTVTSSDYRRAQENTASSSQSRISRTTTDLRWGYIIKLAAIREFALGRLALRRACTAPADAFSAAEDECVKHMLEADRLAREHAGERSRVGLQSFAYPMTSLAELYRKKKGLRPDSTDKLSALAKQQDYYTRALSHQMPSHIQCLTLNNLAFCLLERYALAWNHQEDREVMRTWLSEAAIHINSAMSIVPCNPIVYATAAELAAATAYHDIRQAPQSLSVARLEQIFVPLERSVRLGFPDYSSAGLSIGSCDAKKFQANLAQDPLLGLCLRAFTPSDVNARIERMCNDLNRTR